MQIRRFVSLLSASCAIALALSPVLAAPAQAPASKPVAQGPVPGTPTTLTLLHNNDGESSLLPITYTVPAGTFGYTNTSSVAYPAGGVSAFDTLINLQRADATVQGNAYINLYSGDAFLASSTLYCSLPLTDTAKPVYDAIAQNQMDYTAHVFGNHEFDFTPEFLLRFVNAFTDSTTLTRTQPFLSANLDFGAEPGYGPLLDPDGLIDNAVQNGQSIGRSMIYTDTTTNQVFGIVAATTPILPTISSPGAVTVTVDITATAAAVQVEIDRLQAAPYNVNKIILSSHMQALSADRELIALLQGVDVAVAGGGDELLVSSTVPTTTQLLPGETQPIFGTYPLTVTDAASRTVYLVTTAGNYKYLGRLDVEFDGAGEVTGIVTATSYPRRVIPTSTSAVNGLGLTDTVSTDAAINAGVIDPLNTCLQGFRDTVVAGLQTPQDVSRNGVRSRETNAGNLVADSFVWAYDQFATNSFNNLPPRSTANPVIAVQNGGGIRQNAGNVLPVGGIITDTGFVSRQNTLDVLAFLTNQVTVITGVTPSEMKTIFERSVANLPGEGGQFLQVSGITVTYNISQPVNSRVISIHLADGRPIVAEGQVVSGAPTVSIVTNSFTAGGGDNYPTFANKTTKLGLRDNAGVFFSYEDAFVGYLRSFPVNAGGIPTVPGTDPRYAATTGQGRLSTTTAKPVFRQWLPIISRQLP
jgi:5'-nucleotidase